MPRDQFLTVMAVLDEETQALMGKWQKHILSSGLQGTQTMGIPFHITLGSFSPEKEAELVSKIRDISACTPRIPIQLKQLNHFGYRVLFAEPEQNDDLKKLHLMFDDNYGNSFPWSPHATLFCGEEEEVKKAFEIAQKEFQTVHANITAIEMGKFFPPQFICRYALLKL